MSDVASDRTQNTGGSLGLIAIVFLLFCLVSLGLAGALFWKQYTVLRTWPEIDAQVMRSDVVQVHLGTQALYDTQLTFVYTLRGEPRVSTVSGMHPTTDVEPQQSKLAKYPVGSHHVLQFNPANPAQVRLGIETKLNSFAVPLWIAAAGLFFGAIAAVLFFFSRPPRSV